MIQPSILCPHCGAEIEIAAKVIQAELPGLFTEVVHKPDRKMLDQSEPTLAKIERLDSDRFSVSGKPLDERDSNRIESESLLGEGRGRESESLIESLREILGVKEWAQNGALWRWRVENHFRATAYAVEDFKIRTPDQQAKISNRGAWLTYRFKKALTEIAAAKAKRQSSA